MDPTRTGPLYSSLSDDPESAERLDRFVLHLAEQVDLLQDAHAAGDLDAIARDAYRLAEISRDVGHETFAAMALRVADVAQQGKGEDTHAALVELTEGAQRVRQGHRGSI